MNEEECWGGIAKAVKYEIERALKSHRLWKADLTLDLDRGSTARDPVLVRLDDQCAFGIWLHQTATPVCRLNPRFSRIAKLHAAFHVEAASVVRLIASGRIEEARASVQLGKYATSTNALVQELTEWLQELGHYPTPVRLALGSTTKKSVPNY